MIFCGDFVFPLCFNESIFSELGADFLRQPKMVNFESTLNSCNGRKITNGIALSSSDDVFISFKFLHVICTSHANNHVTDFKFDKNKFVKKFSDHGIEAIGLGLNLDAAAKPFIYESEKLLILSFGWEPIRCNAPKNNRTGINPYRYKWVEKLVLKLKHDYTDYRIVLFLHWNFEFEAYPQPADRQFSHHLIDIGVDAIFGLHSHIIGGYEIYKGKPIFYSLGNLYFPQVKYGDHHLNFRNSALDGISVDYNGNIYDIKIFHHKQDKIGSILKLEDCYKLGEFEKLNQLSEFRNLDHKSYIQFYRENRFHKRRLLPIYKDYNNDFSNLIFDNIVKLRQIPIDILCSLRNMLYKS